MAIQTLWSSASWIGAIWVYTCKLLCRSPLGWAVPWPAWGQMFSTLLFIYITVSFSIFLTSINIFAYLSFRVILSMTGHSNVSWYTTRMQHKSHIYRHNHEYANKRIRYDIPNVVNNTPHNIIDNIYTHSLQGFSRYVKTICYNHTKLTALL